MDLVVPDIGDVANYLVRNKAVSRHNMEQDVKFLVRPTSASSISLSIPEEVYVRVSYINSDLIFWIQLVSNSDVIEQIRHNLRHLDLNYSSYVSPISVKWLMCSYICHEFQTI